MPIYYNFEPCIGQFYDHPKEIKKTLLSYFSYIL